MIRIVLAVFIYCIGQQSIAQTVTVRSGDHPSFSRLVLTVGDQTGWELIQSSAGFTLQKPEFERDFQLDDVFERIQRDRIASVASTTPGVLEIALNCECHGDMFPYGSTQIVVDVIDGPAPEDWNGPFFSGTPEPVMQAKTEGSIAEPAGTVNLPVLFAETRNEPKEVSGDTNNVLEIQTQQPNPMVAEMQLRLLEQISQAAGQGLLSPNLNEETVIKNVPSQTETAAEKVEETEQFENLSPMPSNLGLNARSSFDELAQLLSPEIANTANSVCSPNFDFAFDGWGRGDDFVSGLAEVRLDQAKSQSENSLPYTQKLLRHYLHYGFGSEAIALVKTLELSPQEQNFLLILGLFLDNPNTYKTDYFQQFSDCDDLLGLMAFLTGQNQVKPSRSMATDLARIMQNLPFHLQIHLGPLWVKRLKENGHSDLGVASARIVETLASEEIPELKIQKAKQAVAEQNLDQAKEIFQQVADSGDQLAVDAFIETIQILLLQGGLPSPSEITVLDSYGREYQDTEREPKLAKLAALSRVITGDVADGLQRYQDLDISRTALDSDLSLIVDLATDETILSLAQQAAQSAEMTGLLEANLKPLEARIDSMGFNQLADRILKRRPTNSLRAVDTAKSQQVEEQNLEPQGEVTLETPQPPSDASLRQLSASIESARKLRETIENSLQNIQVSSPNS